MNIKDKLKKSKLLVKFIRFIRSKVLGRLALFFSDVNNKRPRTLATNIETNRTTKVIVSLTTFPERINLVHKALYSIMGQTYKPDKIILWLAKSQFPNKENDLPIKVTELVNYGLSIMWVDKDIKSYKKLIPTLKLYPNDIIITADDDLYYPKDWIISLIESYNSYPDDIHSHLITRISYKKGNVNILPRDKELINKPSYSNKLLGGSGTLYPPHSLSNEVLNEKVFMKIAPTSNDIWFWGAALKQKTKIRWIKNNMKELYYVEGSQDTKCLTDINDSNEKLFFKHMVNVIDYFDLENLL
jgi:hypothetical protein